MEERAMKADEDMRRKRSESKEALSPRSSALSGGGADDNEYRKKRLSECFKGFDIDGGGTMGSEELMELGTARRKLGQKSGTWTKEQNDRMIANMKDGKKGEVVEAEFVKFFVGMLPRDRKEFDTNIEQFLNVAEACRKKAAAGAKQQSEPESPESPRAKRFREQQEQKTMLGAGEDTDHVADAQHRSDRLADVFQRFLIVDHDGGGTLGAEELMELGTARRKLGQKSGEWTKEQNDRLMSKMDKGGDGEIESAEFAAYFATVLPKERPEFDKVIEQFVEVADAFKKKKLESIDDRAQKAEEAMRKKREQEERDRLAREKAERDAAAKRDAEALADKKYRVGRLDAVHKLFDLDGGGFVSKAELQELGQARRKMGQKGGQWTEAQNARLVAKIDKDGDGEIDIAEFSGYFHEALPKPRPEFDIVVDQFMEVGRQLNKNKLDKHAKKAESLEEENARLKAEMERMRKQMVQMEAAARDWKSLEAQLRARIKDLEDQLKKLKDECDYLRKEEKTDKREIDRLNKRIADMEAELARLRAAPAPEPAKNLNDGDFLLKKCIARWTHMQMFAAFNTYRDEASICRRRNQKLLLFLAKIKRRNETRAFDKLKDYAEAKKLAELHSISDAFIATPRRLKSKS